MGSKHRTAPVVLGWMSREPAAASQETASPGAPGSRQEWLLWPEPCSLLGSLLLQGWVPCHRQVALPAGKGAVRASATGCCCTQQEHSKAEEEKLSSLVADLQQQGNPEEEAGSLAEVMSSSGAVVLLA